MSELKQLQASQRIEAFLTAFQFEMTGQTTATGEIAGVPASLSILSGDPLGLMFQFRCQPAEIALEELAESLPELPVPSSQLDWDGRSVWVMLYNLDQLPDAELRSWLEELAGALQETDLAIRPGCLRCGDMEKALLMTVEGQPTRLCPACLEAAIQERQEQAAHLDQPSLKATLGLPGACAFVAIGWAVFWLLVDGFLMWMNTNIIDINQFTMLVFMGVLMAVGAGLGWPLGATLRNSVALRKAPVLMSLLLVSGSALAGEILYVAICLFRFAGVFDLELAAGLLGQVLSHYTKFWCFNKVVVAIAVAWVAAESASHRDTVPLNI